jgi:IPT/TIG domain
VSSGYAKVVSLAGALATTLVLVASASAITAKPSVTSFSPSRGAVGTKVTITGRNLSNTVTVKVGGVIAPFKVNSATKVTATVPAKAKSGKISVSETRPPAPTYYGSSSRSFSVTG